MHEYGIVQSLLSQVDKEVRDHEGKRAVRVVVAIDGGHVDEAFLRDAFDTFKSSSSACAAELVVTQAGVDVWCPACESRATVVRGELLCPKCANPTVRLKRTEEIFLQSVEIEV